MIKIERVLVYMHYEKMFGPRERALLAGSIPDAAFDFLWQGEEARWEDYGIIVGNPPLGRLGSCARLRLLQLTSAGTASYPQAVRALGREVALTNATGAYGPAIAEHMLGMLLALQKKLLLYRDQMRGGLWRDRGKVVALSGARVLVVGMGDIGSCFGRLCAACGARVTGVRRTPGPKPDYAEAVHVTDRLDELLPDADVIALSVPETKDTVRFIDRRRLALMKQGAILLNVGRGSAVDTEALCSALESGHLGGAGLDVTDPEPLPAGHRLWGCENALVTPHVSGGDHLPATIERIAAIAADNLGRFVRGEELRNPVDFETGYRRSDRR